jgi:hypothetical protein
VEVAVSLEEATRLEPRGPGVYGVDLRQEYAIGANKPNGGYLLACLGRAALTAAREAGSTHQHVIAAGATYLASPDLGPARIETTVLRVGKTASQVRARISNGDNLGVEARFTLANLPEDGEPYWGGGPAVVLPAWEDCDARPGASERGLSVVFDPATTFRPGAEGPEVTGGGEFRAWLRNDRSGRLDTLGLLYAADSLPPATFGVVATGWVPTLDLTVYIRAIPVEGPLRLRFRVQMIQDGFADEVCEGWDAAGRLVFQSTQLAALRHPPRAD